MSTDPHASPRRLGDRPNLRDLRDQAEELVSAGSAVSLAEAQLTVARAYGVSSWPELEAHVEAREEVGQLKEAINREDLSTIASMMTRNPALHRAPLGYGNNGPLTWVAECRVPWRPPTPMRLAIAKWMIENGSDVHQGGDGPLMRAALNSDRVPMMELLVSHGADVNAEWNGDYPIIFAACGAVDPDSLKWLLQHGADPNCGNVPGRGTALDYVLGTYARSAERLSACIDLLVAAGGSTKCNAPGVLDVLRGDVNALVHRLEHDPQLVHRRFPELDFGSTGGRRLLLGGATLLHVAAEFGCIDVARLLLDRGADINTRAMVNAAGIGGQTPIFHSATQFFDHRLAMTRFLVERGADLTVRVKVPGHYESPDEFIECTPLAYAARFEQEAESSQTVAFLRERGARE